ncbi:hypothetical protein IBT47_01120 [Erwinia sp. S43]|uniref:hypothetical protein n=1 Tax=Erwinia sp. S43 TaxID=2769339 RepID=UPI00190B72A9|nr:hypothetical protein [Erwinia sp. S43]MBK0030873.1 hypothetical protein [Erwinia sp. S43]
MLINASHFPRVWLHLIDKTQSTEEGFALYLELLERGESFVLLNAEGLDFSAYPQSKDEMQYVAQWRKTHRALLRQRILAAIFIEPDVALRDAAQEFAVGYSKFWGYPMLIVASETEALLTADRLLSAQQ